VVLDRAKEKGLGTLLPFMEDNLPFA